MTINYQNPQQPQNPLINLINNNRGVPVTIYMHFDQSQWGSKVFKGNIVSFELDYILLKDSVSQQTHLLPTAYLSYLVFEEPLRN